MEPNKLSEESYPPIGRLELLFRRPPEITALPVTVKLLGRLLDTHASPLDLEMVMSSDPGLYLRFLKLNGDYDTKTSRRALDIRFAIAHRGNQAIKTFLSASVIGGFVAEKSPVPEWEPFRFARHCLFVGAFSARYAETFPSAKFTPAEAQSVGILHDLGLMVLAAVHPQALAQVCQFSRQCGVGFDISFSCVYPKPISALGAAAAEAYGLDLKLAKVLDTFDQGSSPTSDLTCVVRLGDWLANANGFGWEPWSSTAALPPLVDAMYSEHKAIFDGLAAEAAMIANQGLITLARERSQVLNAA